MWWYFKKIFEDDNIVRYAYSRESYDADGEMECDRLYTYELVTKPSDTTPTKKGQEWSLTHLYDVFLQGFPDETRIICG